MNNIAKHGNQKNVNMVTSKTKVASIFIAIIMALMVLVAFTIPQDTVAASKHKACSSSCLKCKSYNNGWNVKGADAKLKVDATHHYIGLDQSIGKFRDCQVSIDGGKVFLLHAMAEEKSVAKKYRGKTCKLKFRWYQRIGKKTYTGPWCKVTTKL